MLREAFGPMVLESRVGRPGLSCARECRRRLVVSCCLWMGVCPSAIVHTP